MPGIQKFLSPIGENGYNSESLKRHFDGMTKGARAMPLELAPDRVESIGEVAGMVWNYLDSHDPVTLSKLAREINVPRDLVMQGVGWLAREEKITFQKGARSKLITLV